jgi:hypothetical protein
MKTFLDRIGRFGLAASLLLAILFAPILAEAANQSLGKVSTANATGVYVQSTAHGLHVIASAASLAAAGADTAICTPIDMYQAGDSPQYEPHVSSTGQFARQLVIWGTAAASVDSARVQYEWSNSTSGPWVSDQTFANTGNNVVTKLNNAAGTNLLTSKSYISAIPARYLRLKFVNADATTAGIVRIHLAIYERRKT